jgi:hypothetical protein
MGSREGEERGRREREKREGERESLRERGRVLAYHVLRERERAYIPCSHGRRSQS